MMIYLYLGLAFITFNLGIAIRSKKKKSNHIEKNFKISKLTKFDNFDFEEYRSVIGDILYLLTAVLIFVAALGSFLVIPSVIINIFGMMVLFGLYKLMRLYYCKNI
jgi:hypothetical protein